MIEGSLQVSLAQKERNKQRKKRKKNERNNEKVKIFERNLLKIRLIKILAIKFWIYEDEYP